jgi:hypothetical protein
MNLQARPNVVDFSSQYHSAKRDEMLPSILIDDKPNDIDKMVRMTEDLPLK